MLILIHNPERTQGMQWCNNEPPEGYFYSVAVNGVNSEPDADFQPVSDLESDHVLHLLRWMYNYLVYFVSGHDVVVHEELIFVVQHVDVTQEPEWCAAVKCFDVRGQQDLTYRFKLVN